jgi:hypothetical protein
MENLDGCVCNPWSQAERKSRTERKESYGRGLESTLLGTLFELKLGGRVIV